MRPIRICLPPFALGPGRIPALKGNLFFRTDRWPSCFRTQVRFRRALSLYTKSEKKKVEIFKAIEQRTHFECAERFAGHKLYQIHAFKPS